MAFQIQNFVYDTPYSPIYGLPKQYFGPNYHGDKLSAVWNVTVFDLDGLGWQWHDASTGEGEGKLGVKQG